MIDPTFEIRRHYVTILAGISVPVINLPTQVLTPPYVTLSTRSREEPGKCSYHYTVTTTIDIVVKTSGDYGGDLMAESIANEILPLVAHKGNLGSTANFAIITAKVESSDPLDELNTQGRIIRKVIQIENFVQQI